ncbi:ankyrin repeat protein [Purpureocillium lavendulum]|uniref:Ankyrin repeat protein n=1 Tax=Purpureocillium lavendulum TaxID=1247861 RepID=A0AB34FG61_9HYPO|nr:ankyrin repeat protein [Purpureocillium lavendulum]
MPGPSGPVYGLHTLVARDPLTADVVDIVAVHGLNGHYEKTWTDELSQYNWLRDVSSGPNKSFMTRVMSFAYNSKVLHSKSTADIFDFADQLLECLLVERQTDMEKSRPIVFICHSLGGIVFKQAFNRAHGVSRYEGLAKKVIGALFFSTPHKGSAVASLGTMLGTMAKALAFGANTNTQLLKDLERHSYKLEQISDTFLQQASGLRIVSFYELDKLDYMSTVIVDKESALMRMKNETLVPLNGNHRDMCKFPTRSDPMLSAVLNNLAIIIRRATTSKTQTAESQLLASLATSNPDLHKSRNPKPVPGTCSWILKHDTFNNWLKSPESALLWLSADPGCGKSVLASFLVDHLRSGEVALKQTNICYFFFKSDSDEQHDAIFGLHAILYQLFQYQAELLQIASQTQSQDLRSVTALWHMLVKVLEHPAARNTMCILDGLDECEPDTRKQLTRLLSDFFASQKNASGQKGAGNGRLKVLIASRPENAFKVAFDRPLQARSGATSTCSMIRLRGEDETDAVSRDVSLVVDAEISDMVDQGLPEELLDSVRQQLVVRADRTFLWVTLILQLLKDKVEAGASRRELDLVMQNRDIDAIYNDLLSARPNAPKARKLLSFIIAATRPLTVEELSIGLAITPEINSYENRTGHKRPGAYSFKNIEDDLVYPFENHLKAVCGHFIRIIRNNVYLVHETAREFLIDSRDAPPASSEMPWVPFDELEDDELVVGSASAPLADHESQLVWQNSFNLLQCHATVLDACVTYIYCMGKSTPGYRTGEPSRRTAPFLEYAAIAWTAHFRQVRDELLQADLSYYQNLCHPQFPGFKPWMQVYHGSEIEKLHLAGQSADEIQDYYVTLFAMEMALGGDHHHLSAAADPRFWEKTVPYSSNPTAAENHHFPVTANANGWVSLNMEKMHTKFDGVEFNPWES